MTRDEMQNILMDYNLVSEETLNVVVRMCGDRPDTYEDLLYVITGYRTFESYLDSVAADTSTTWVGDKLCNVIKEEMTK